MGAREPDVELTPAEAVEATLQLNPPDGGALLTAWITVSVWVDAETGDVTTSTLEPKGQPFFHRAGLLHTALYEWENDNDGS